MKSEQTNSTSWGQQNKLYLKIAFMLLLIALLLIPKVMITDLIYERKSYQQEVDREISQTWGGSQILAPPILSIPYTKYSIYEKDGKEEKSFFEKSIYITPETAKIDADATTEKRSLGIYSSIIYTATNQINSSFNITIDSTFESNIDKIHFSKAILHLPISDPTRVASITYLNFNGKKYKMEVYNNDLGSGLMAEIDINDIPSPKFDIELVLKGSQNLHFLPVASFQEVELNSNWNSPGFTGSALPVSRDITNDGFTSLWNSTEYASSLPRTWISSSPQTVFNSGSKYGVDFIQTVDHYQKNMRAVKYAILIIVLSFLVFFFFELKRNKSIHIIQYVLVGLAILLFYLLLLSLSEHLGFNVAYLISTLMSVSLISWYAKTILNYNKAALMLFGILIALFSYIYILLQLEDYALLAGSIGLFIILFIVMKVSSKIRALSEK